MSKAGTNSENDKPVLKADFIDRVKNGEVGEETQKQFILDEERAGRILALAEDVEARMAEYIGDRLMVESYNIVEASRFNDFYDLMLRTSKTLRKRENKTQEETARRLESIGIEWDAKIKLPMPKFRPDYLTDRMYWILKQIELYDYPETTKEPILEQVNGYQFYWNRSASLYGAFCKSVTRCWKYYKSDKGDIDFKSFSEIFVNGAELSNTAITEASRNRVFNETYIIQDVLDAYAKANREGRIPHYDM